jgi:hypothetical protein
LTEQGRATVLAVGDSEEWLRQGHELPPENVVFVAFGDLSEGTLARFRPTVIVSPVLANEYDCIELTLLLRNVGYKGIYRAVGHNMPRPELIEREVSQLYPELNFQIDIQD